MTRHTVLTTLLCAGLALAGCTTQQTQQANNTIATVQTDLATVRADARQAVLLYGVAKGLAQVAEVSYPALAPKIEAAIAFLDPKVALAQQALDTGSTDAAALLALAQTITQQASSLTTTAAPLVAVVPAAVPNVAAMSKG